MLASVSRMRRHDFASVSMDTEIHIQVVSPESRETVALAVDSALEWFQTVERVCTRFDPTSEVMRLLHHVGKPVRVSPLLFEVVSFALDLAEQTGGAFDPTIGAQLERLGFNVNYLTGEAIHTETDQAATYRDVRLDRGAGTILLRRPLVIDVNAVCKGLAIDLAAKQLEQFGHFCVEAGGDLYVGGRNATGELWHVGIQHPRAEGLLVRTLRLTDTAVCTSGDYERRASAEQGGATHILDARTRQPATDLAAVTVVAPTAMAADGLSTAAMALGRERGIEFITAQDVGGLFMMPDGEVLKVNL